ncbi:MAG TPA: PKD-like family lipoprotein, partial [Puia sp.]
MQRNLYCLLIGICLLAASCYKDKGNYVYHVPAAPVVTNLADAYPAIIGDTLTIRPNVSIPGVKNIGYEWRLNLPFPDTARYYYGPQLKMVFAFKPMRYGARLTVIDSSNGMKYFYSFFIDGSTVYSSGTTVLSQEGGKTQLSFILPDGTVKPRVYSAINEEDLPAGPQQVIALYDQYISGGTYFGYWILCSGGADPGVQIDPNTFQKVKTLRENFFTPPASVNTGTCVNIPGTGTINGVLNGKLYVGASQTYYGSPVYGQFGLATTGDYNLYHQAIFNPTFPYFLGYDSVRKQVVAFTNFGSASYIGTGYQTTTTGPFDPANLGLDLVDFEQINSQNCYVFGKASDGTLYEAKFG